MLGFMPTLLDRQSDSRLESTEAEVAQRVVAKHGLG